MTDRRWRWLRFVRVLVSDWTVVSASLFAVVGHVAWRAESGKWSLGLLCAQVAAIVAVAVGTEYWVSNRRRWYE